MKTVNLELSKQLKEAGYPQSTDFVWVETEGLGIELLKRSTGIAEWGNVIACSPTADEILDLLPMQLKTKDFLSIQKFNTYWVGYGASTNTYVHRDDESIADAAAKMWLYLKKEGLL